MAVLKHTGELVAIAAPPRWGTDVWLTEKGRQLRSAQIDRLIDRGDLGY
jgi:hypothetical protein